MYADSDVGIGLAQDVAILPALNPPWGQRALLFFVDQYVIPGEESAGTPGWLDFLPELYSNSEGNSCLESAVTAVSSASLANQSGSSWRMTEARYAYGTALKSTNAALKARDQALNDETLLAIILLCVFGVNGPITKPIR